MIFECLCMVDLSVCYEDISAANTAGCTEWILCCDISISLTQFSLWLVVCHVNCCSCCSFNSIMYQITSQVSKCLRLSSSSAGVAPASSVWQLMWIKRTLNTWWILIWMLGIIIHYRWRLSVPCKILESIIQEIMIKYLDSNKFISTSQHRFVSNTRWPQSRRKNSPSFPEP